MKGSEYYIEEPLLLYVNGSRILEPNPDPRTSLASYLRRQLRLPGTKIGCGEGGCGACTIMVSSWNGESVEHVSLNACLVPLVSLHYKAITTVEGIGSTKTKLHEIQRRLADAHGSQCGFCTPGFVMSMYTLLRNNSDPKFEDILTYFQGNLCRCTGYRPILEACKTFTNPCGKETTEEKCVCRASIELNENESKHNYLFDKRKLRTLDPSQEPIFPAALRSSPFKLPPRKYTGPDFSWYVPSSLSELLDLKEEFPSGRIICGNTEVGIEMKLKKDLRVLPVMIQSTQVNELNKIEVKESHLEIGASVSLSKVESICEDLLTSRKTSQLAVIRELNAMLHVFASKQIRNVASFGGNISTGSPISDLLPLLMASSSYLRVGSLRGGQWKVPIDEKFFLGYRNSILKNNEVIISVMIPFSSPNQSFRAYKVSRRKDDDIAIVNGGFSFHISSGVITEARIAFGGVSSSSLLLMKTNSFLKGKYWCESTIESAMDSICKEVHIPQGSPGGMETYRRSLMLSLLFKAFLSISEELNGGQTLVPKVVDFSSLQLFGISPSDPLGRPKKHTSADLHTTGEAQYVDDESTRGNEVFGAFVYSQRAHAKIVAVHDSGALESPGVIGFLSSKDIPKDRNSFCVSLNRDETVFAEGSVQCCGQILGIILADTQEHARAGASQVKVEYNDLDSILSIHEAIRRSSFFPLTHSGLTCGNPLKAFERAEHVVEGEVFTGGQEHFYLETQCGIVTPREVGVLIHSSTQNPTETQSCVAQMLNLPMSQVSVEVKRLGGGFGGKETRSIPFVMAATWAAVKFGRPVRFSLERDEDMVMTGYRHPFLGQYKVGFDARGMIQALDLKVYANAGYTMDLSFAALERALLHSENSYKVSHLKVEGFCCKTNLPSNTAFRGFGGPQAMMIVEHYIESIACALGLPPEVVRERNLYKNGDSTYYGQKLNHCTLSTCWRECQILSQFHKARESVQEFNEAHTWTKRGISMIPTKYGIAFGLPHLNQGGALLHVYKDGSVLATHGGVEMGQGLHIKMAQVISKVLEVPLELINIMSTSTEKVPNTSATAASLGSDLYGMALKTASEAIRVRLTPLMVKFPEAAWVEIVAKAYESSISLSSTGHYSVPDLGMDWERGLGRPYNYFTYGVGASLVEVDLLTGSHSLLRTDIVMDLGESLNPAIDVGQIEGAFMQGYGLFVMEQILSTPAGKLITKGPSNYKIPGASDIPRVFNVSLLRGSKNTRAVYSSKAVGEPPLFLASSIYFAIKDALKSARLENGQGGDFHLPIPATPERIRLSVGDWILDKASPSQAQGEPWSMQI